MSLCMFGNQTPFSRPHCVFAEYSDKHSLHVKRVCVLWFWRTDSRRRFAGSRGASEFPVPGGRGILGVREPFGDALFLAGQLDVSPAHTEAGTNGCGELSPRSSLRWWQEERTLM